MKEISVYLKDKCKFTGDRINMKNITRKILSIGLSLALLGSLSGCKLQTDKKAVETTATSIEKSEIVLWYTNEELSDYIEAAANEYESENHVAVNTKLISAIDYIENINQAVLSEDLEPDLFIAENSNLEKIYLAGLALENSDEVLSENNYYKTALSAFTYKDKLLAYPMYFETSYLLYNQEYVQSPPSTIDDILTFSDEFDAPEGVESIFNWDVSDILSNYFFIGNYLNNEEINNENYISDKAKLVESLVYYQNLNQYFAIDAQTIDYETAFQNFIDGKSVFTIAKTDKLPEIEMIEGDVNEEVQNDSNEEDQASDDANEEGLNEAEENETSQTQDEKNVSQTDEETSKDDETNTESASKESGETSKINNGLENNYYAGIERIFRLNQSSESTGETSSTIADKNSNFKIAALPNLTNELEGKTIAINYGVFVNGYTKQKEAAEAFAKYLTYDRAQSLYKEAGKLSVRSNISYNNENLSTILKQYETSVSAPKVMENGDFWLKLEIAFSNIWKGADVEQSIEEMLN